MPRRYGSENRPADVVGCAVTVARLSFGDVEKTLTQPSGRVGTGHAGVKARAESLTPDEGQETARKAAGARWR